MRRPLPAASRPLPGNNISAWNIPRSYPREAFIPDGNPYLGQAVPGEPLYQTNVLSRTGDTRDETSIRRARRPLPVIILRIR